MQSEPTDEFQSFAPNHLEDLKAHNRNSLSNYAHPRPNSKLSLNADKLVKTKPNKKTQSFLLIRLCTYQAVSVFFDRKAVAREVSSPG